VSKNARRLIWTLFYMVMGGADWFGGINIQPCANSQRTTESSPGLVIQDKFPLYPQTPISPKTKTQKPLSSPPPPGGGRVPLLRNFSPCYYYHFPSHLHSIPCEIKAPSTRRLHTARRRTRCGSPLLCPRFHGVFCARAHGCGSESESESEGSGSDRCHHRSRSCLKRRKINWTFGSDFDSDSDLPLCAFVSHAARFPRR
jgi:hypothetical protein